jgi:6-carboxyhexanoate--CoA ligase
MDQDLLYSVRMRASTANRHISGAERIVPPKRVDEVVQLLIARARNKKLLPEQIVITIENISNIPLRILTALDVVTINSPDMIAGRSAACRVLQSLSISEKAVQKSIEIISSGASPSGMNLRGAMIVDAVTGERLEPDQDRGVRASRFDWTDEALDSITKKLAAIGLTHFRTQEALALATKVAHAPGMIAELCWSDEPDYTAGYVASRSIGYVRFPKLKLQDDPRGGRVFFVDRNSLDREAFIHYLQLEPVMIDNCGECSHSVEPEQYFA